MINYIEKGIYLHDYISELGYSLIENDGVWESSDDIAVQNIIDTFDPLPYAIAEAKNIIKDASAKHRLKFVTAAAGKDAEYTYKANEADLYIADGTIGVFMQGRIDATQETPAAIAASWAAKSASWKQIGASIAGIEDKASIDLSNVTDFTQCKTISDSAILALEAI